MKNKWLTMLVLVSVLLLTTIAPGCGAPDITKPTVGYVPEGWYCSAEDPYGTYEELDGTKSGLLEYTDAEDYDSVQIFYGDIPPELKGNEENMASLTAKAVEWASAFDPDETGTMTVIGQLAGYAKSYDDELEIYDLEIVFVKGSTCIDIYSMYDATAEDEAQIMSIINSIDLREG